MHAITIYSKDYCPYCKAAKAFLDKRGFDYVEIDVLRNSEKLSEMLTKSKRRTVPQIFFGDRHIGGYTDLIEYIN